MKKMLVILCGFLLVFGMVGGAQALPLPPAPEYIGGYVGNDNPTLPGDVASLNGLIDTYNWDTPVDSPANLQDFELPHVGTSLKVPNGGDLNDVKFGTVSLPSGWDYITLKYSTNVDLWWIRGETTFTFPAGEGLDLLPGGEDQPDWILAHGISHYTFWNPSPSRVPEPSAMFLLGTGLIGLATIGRRKFKK